MFSSLADAEKVPIIFQDDEKLKRWRQRRLILSKILECIENRIVSVHFASNQKDLTEAFNLIYRRYLAVGLIEENIQKLYFTPYQFLPDSRVAIARDIKTKEVTSTATIVLDSKEGLPSDRLYKDIIDQLREENIRLAEYTCLAALPDIHSMNGLLYVLRLLGRYALFKGVTGVIASIHPKHAEFYEKILLFERKGELRYYPGLKNAPAYLEFLDFKNLYVRYFSAYADFPEGYLFYRFFFKKDLLSDLKKIRENASPEAYKDFFFTIRDQ